MNESVTAGASGQSSSSKHNLRSVVSIFFIKYSQIMNQQWSIERYTEWMQTGSVNMGNNEAKNSCSHLLIELIKSWHPFDPRDKDNCRYGPNQRIKARLLKPILKNFLCRT